MADEAESSSGTTANDAVIRGDEMQTPDDAPDQGPAEKVRSTIALTVHNSRSAVTTVVTGLMRPLRPRLVKFGKPLPEGSPRLHPPKMSGCKISERLVAQVYVYDFFPTTATGPAADGVGQQSLFYFAGGGFQGPPSREHWKFCTKLAQRLWGSYKVSLVSYPLAPNNTADKSLPILRTWLDAVVEAAVAGKEQKITLAGDSSGGNIALSLGFWWAGKCQNPEGRTPTLNQLLVMSPATDLRNENQKIEEMDRHDPVLTKVVIEEVARTWVGNLSRSDPAVSPVLADFSALRRSGIKIHGVVGSYDVLAPDAVAFRELCAKQHITGEWLHWERQMHCFPLAGLAEGKRAIDWMVDVLKRNV